MDIEARTSDYVCIDCGIQYLTEEQKNSGELSVATAHKADCGLCGTETTVVHIRHYNYLYKPEEDASKN